MIKSVLLAHLSQEQSLIWHDVLLAHKIEVWAFHESEDLLHMLEQKRTSNQGLPQLVISDMYGIRPGGSGLLLATELCKWCADYVPQMKVLLINPRQSQIKEVEKKWAIRRGAIDLLPQISAKNLSSAFVTVARALEIEVKPKVLTSVIKNIQRQQQHADKGAIQGKNIRQTATQELARKMAMIPLMVMANEPEAELNEDKLPSLNPKKQLALDSNICELELFDTQVDLDKTGAFTKQLFNDNPLLPALIVYDRNEYVGMLSRRRFLECLSRPYALELFTKRPLRVLYEQVNVEVMELEGNTPIVTASQLALSRSGDEIYEPVIVRLADDQHAVLDVHSLLQSQSHIHELATKLLREQAQTTMFQTEKMASLGQIVAEVSHDIRNPAVKIHNNTESLVTYIDGLMKILRTYEKEYGTQSPTISKMIKEVEWELIRTDLPQVVQGIRSGSRYLNRLVDTLQSLSHMEDHSTPGPLSIVECVESSLTILSGRTKGVQIVKKYGEIPQVNGLCDRIIQVFINLISNAIDALLDLKLHPELIRQREYMLMREDERFEDSLAHGNVQTDVDITWQPLLMISSAIATIDNRDWVSVKIADNGMGIPSDMQNHIFDNFFTNKGEGKPTGLGLAVCHQVITQQHHGKIILRSPYLNYKGDVTIGSEFEVLLPI